MRLVVLFDLPVIKKTERKDYTRFRKFLIKDGYDMIQFSIYGRICNGLDAVDKHVERLKDNAPPKGSVRYFSMTEKQFTDMKVLVGTKKAKENPKYTEQLALF